MEMGQDVRFSIALCNNLSTFQIEALANASLAVVLDSAREDSTLVGPIFEEMEVDLIKRIYSAIVCLYLEAAKNDLLAMELFTFLNKECGGLSEEKTELLCRIYGERKQDLRGMLSRTSNYSALPSLVGVDCTLEYCVPTSSAEDLHALRELVYKVSLKTKDGVSGKDEEVKFLCSIEGLQDLISRLKDACRSVERAVDRRS